MEPNDRDDTIDDAITERVLSDSAYEHERIQRFSYFRQSIPRKLAMQGLLLGSLVLLIPLYSLYPESSAAYLPSMNPVVASPKVLLLGTVGAAVELGTAALLVGAALYRVRHEPLTEKQARSIVNVEEFASHVGVGTGGLVILFTLAFFALGLGGGDMLAWYLDMEGGVNPFSATPVPFGVGHLGAAALAGALAIAVARGYVATRLSELEG